MLTALTVENFKGIAAPVRLELRPITLLFGANGAGKTSLLHALHYAREIIERHNLDADCTLSGGDIVDLGGFQSFVHNHDLTRPVRLSFELDLSEVDLPYTGFLWCDASLIQETQKVLESTSGLVESAKVELAVAWHKETVRYHVAEYRVSLNGRLLATIRSRPEEAGAVELCEIQADHPVLLEAITGRATLEGPGDVSPLAGATRIPLGDQADALPSFQWGRLLTLASAGGSAGAEDFAFPFDLAALLSLCLVGPGQLVRDALSGFRSIGPLREVPPRNYQPPRYPDESRWASGIGAWDTLYRAGAPLVDRVSKALAGPDGLNTGYELVFFEDTEQGASESAGKPTGAGGPRQRRLEFRSVGHPEVGLSPRDLGVGISQMLPLVVAALDDRPQGAANLPVQLVACEQPELHIHPRLQADLADVVIEAVANPRAKGRILILETHSEHLTLRLLRRIRETGAGTAPGGRALKPAQLGIWYIDRKEERVVAEHIDVDVNGELVQPWPDTFFEQDFLERFS